MTRADGSSMLLEFPRAQELNVVGRHACRLHTPRFGGGDQRLVSQHEDSSTSDGAVSQSLTSGVTIGYRGATVEVLYH